MRCQAMPHDVRRGQNRVEDSSPSLILLKKECSCKAAGQQHLDQHLHLLQAGFAAEKGVLKECVLFGIWTAWWSWWCITKRRCRNAKVIIIIISRRSHSLFNDLGVFFFHFFLPFFTTFFPLHDDYQSAFTSVKKVCIYTSDDQAIHNND